MLSFKNVFRGFCSLIKNKFFFLYVTFQVLMIAVSAALTVEIFTAPKALENTTTIVFCIVCLFLNAALGLSLFAEGILSPYLCITDACKPCERKQNYADELIDLLEKKRGANEKNKNYQLLQKQAQINALRQQINPHFLYNALDSARGLAYSENAKKTADMIESLAVFFRYTISGKDDLVSLFDEMRGIENYVTIQQYRFIHSVQFRYQMDLTDEQVHQTMLPRLTLQPLVENAFKHGLLYKKEDAEILIKMITTRTRLIISIIDNGCGIPLQKLCEINEQLRNGTQANSSPQKEQGTGIALQNVNSRIRIHFGNEYGLCLFSTPGLGTEVQITIPLSGVSQNNE